MSVDDSIRYSEGSIQRRFAPTCPNSPVRCPNSSEARADFTEIRSRTKAKVCLSALERLKQHPTGRYILVTAINPTPLGEGKTTTSIGLTMGFCRKGHQAVVTLRQPSIGPVFGMKGGGTGGGRAQVVPMEDINLHLTGDAHAVAASHNLLSAFADNHLFHGNELDWTQAG